MTPDKLKTNNNYRHSKYEGAIRKLRTRIYAEHPEYNPFKRTRRRLFTTKSLYSIAFEKIINSGDSRLYVQAVKSIPKALYDQLLMHFITSHSNQTVSRDLWLTVAAQNKIYKYDLDDTVFNWNWLNLTVEQCFLFRCYNWFDNVPSFTRKTSIDTTTPYSVRLDSYFIGHTSSVCHSCIRRGFSNIEIRETIKQQYNSNSSGLLAPGRWFYTFFNEIQSWCCACNIQPLFSIIELGNYL